MILPFFYIAGLDLSQNEILLDEDTSKHVISVLRMKKGDGINLTDGKGNLFTTVIVDDHKKHCAVRVTEAAKQQAPAFKITIAISLLKNASRFEWFLEKATEIGVTEMIPLVSKRTEKQKFRSDRMQNILVSAMLQSRQTWLPVLHEPIAYELLFRQQELETVSQKFIAHCIEEDKKSIGELIDSSAASRMILIGPEGDFTPEEVALALQNNFIPVTLGPTRLRTETAGIVAASLLRHI